MQGTGQHDEVALSILSHVLPEETKLRVTSVASGELFTFPSLPNY